MTALRWGLAAACGAMLLAQAVAALCAAGILLGQLADDASLEVDPDTDRV